ncbi:MAG: isochorismatase family cysteine hydrolase [Alphaproteobacteria bacterium]
MVDFAIVPSKTALINVDMQNVFVENSPIAAPDGPIVLKRINRLSAECRKAGILVVHTIVGYRPDHSNVGIASEFAGDVISKRLLDLDQPSAALHPGLVVEPGDILLEKPRYGAFYATDLELILRSRGIDTVIITGICTNVCCETTAREAAVRDFKVLFTSDGTATFDFGGLTRQEIQRATCASLSLVFAQVLTVDDVIAKINGGKRAAA